MDKYELDKKLEKLAEILSELGNVHEDMNVLSSRLGDAIYKLEVKLEAFGDEIDKEK